MLTLPAFAQEVGTVAAVEGTAEIGHGATWAPAEVGAAIALGDQLRTGRPGNLRVVFQDDSLLTLAPDSQVTVDEQVFVPSAGKFQSLIGLLRGKVGAAVSDYYHGAGARYEIKTPNAVAGVRGTQFWMSYSPEEDVTQVVGISGVVSVSSVLDPSAPGILVTAKEATTISAGEPPTPPRRLDDAIFRQQMLESDSLGAGWQDSLSNSHAVVAHSSVPQPDRAPAVAAGFSSIGDGNAPGTGTISLQTHDASSIIGQPPASVIAPTTGSLGIDVGHH